MSEAKKLPQYVAAMCVCIGALASGTVLGWTSTITEDLKEGKLGDIKMDDDMLGWVGSIMPIGAMLTCFPIGWVTNMLGRKPTTLLLTIPFVIGWLLIAFPQHIAMVYAGRVLNGLAVGAFCVCAPLYVGEIAQTEIRGQLGTFFQLFITLGILMAYVCGSVFGMLLYIFICTAIPIVFAVVFLFQPETPFYNLWKGNQEKADKSMKKLRGKEYDSSKEMKAMQDEISKTKETEGAFWVTLKTKAGIKANIICLALMFYQQLCGINAVIFYMGDIFKSAGSSLDPKVSTIIIGVVQVIATLGASLFIEKVGRKILLIVSCAAMAFSTFLLGIFFTIQIRKLASEDTIKTLGFLPIAALVIFIIAFSIGMGPIPWCAAAELLAPEIRPVCSSVAAFFNWLLAFIVTKVYFFCVKAIGGDITFYIFTGISVTGVFFMLIFVPETKGKTIQEVQLILEGKE